MSAQQDALVEMRRLGAAEGRAAAMWLRRHVNSVRKDLGLRTVEGQAFVDLSVAMKNFTASLSTAAKSFEVARKTLT